MPVSPADTCLRRVRPIHVVPDPKAPGGLRASAAAFEDDSDGSSMSVCLRSVTVAIGLTDASVVHGKESRWAVAAIPVQILINEEQVVEPNPIVDPPTPHPCDPAHALVHGEKRPKGRRDRISKASPLVHIVP
jgi:hypothetical protein